MDGLGGRVLAAGTAGHVLDFDDTYAPGLAHLSAPTAPAALLLDAELDATVGDVLAGHAAGFEAMGALARASHPALYERGWHPTAVCGAVGAAVSAARLLGAGAEATDTATRLALVRAGGLRRAFGSDAKALQVGAAAAAGVTAARLAVAGATATQDLATGPGGFEQAFGGRWARPDGEAAVAENWIKAYPCCLQTHSPIEAAQTARATAGAEAAPVTVVVHPRARQAAPYDDVADGLQAKFSIPYTVAYTLLHGVPSAPSCFSALRARVNEAGAARDRSPARARRGAGGEGGDCHGLAESADDRRAAGRQSLHARRHAPDEHARVARYGGPRPGSSGPRGAVGGTPLVSRRSALPLQLCRLPPSPL